MRNVKSTLVLLENLWEVSGMFIVSSHPRIDGGIGVESLTKVYFIQDAN